MPTARTIQQTDVRRPCAKEAGGSEVTGAAGETQAGVAGHPCPTAGAALQLPMLQQPSTGQGSAEWKQAMASEAKGFEQHTHGRMHTSQARGAPSATLSTKLWIGPRPARGVTEQQERQCGVRKARRQNPHEVNLPRPSLRGKSSGHWTLTGGPSVPQCWHFEITLVASFSFCDRCDARATWRSCSSKSRSRTSVAHESPLLEVS
eukprot:CAMPEP_0178423402 /NCGR_PEP_ID=MMETSP0689_2-20121128/27670_1 /TAXON_ID=160604 /ORGANISM="Amphidinium massartii, Strain CS-259" /LENGTH=204 /DNA_ID=CAMNT_0020044995 /DNA_START=311 /DNA_END=922 /DNA_ORIENTATION=+